MTVSNQAGSTPGLPEPPAASRPLDRFTILSWRAPASAAKTLEDATISPGERSRLLPAAKAAFGTPGLAYVATCQRVLWVFQDPPGDIEGRLDGFYLRQQGVRLPGAERWDGFAAFRHLAEVACSMDSLVPGEPQILGQVKDAMQVCDRAGVLGTQLRHVFDFALRTAKTVRSQTRFFEGKVSILPLVEATLREALAGRAKPAAAVVGTGEMAVKTIGMLQQIRPDCKIYLVSRAFQRARRHAEDSLVEPVDLPTFLNMERACDAVVLAMQTTEPIVSASWLTQRSASTPLTVIDLGMPRNAEVPPTALRGLRLVQLDDIIALSQQAKSRRSAAYDDAVRILEDELDRIEQDYNVRCHASAIHQLSQRFQAVSEQRWRGAESHVDVTDPKTRKWFDQTVRALLHEATQIVKSPWAGRPR